MARKRTTKTEITTPRPPTTAAPSGIAVEGGIYAGRDVIMGVESCEIVPLQSNNNRTPVFKPQSRVR